MIPAVGPRLILIDGLPGSGKTTLALALGEKIPNAKVLLENRGENPLHAVPAEEDVAEFGAIYDFSVEQFAELSLQAWRRFVESANLRTYIAESYPFQSGVRLLLQMDADRSLIWNYFAAIEEIVTPLDPLLIFLRLRDPGDDLRTVSELRGAEWHAAVRSFVGRTTWARNRLLTGDEAIWQFVSAYAALVDELLADSAIPRLELEGGAKFGPSTIQSALARHGPI